MKNKKSKLTLNTKVEEAYLALKAFCTSQDKINFNDSFRVSYECQIEENEVTEEKINLNAEFSNYPFICSHSYGTYVNDAHDLAEAMKGMEEYFSKFIVELEQGKRKKEREQNEEKVLEAYRAGKISI